MNAIGFERKKGIWGLLALAVFLFLTSGCQWWKTENTTNIYQTVMEKNTLFFDDFDLTKTDLRNVWLQNGKGHWAWANGWLMQNSEDSRALNTIMYVSTPQFSNGIIEVKARMNYDKSVDPTKEELNNLRKFIGAGIVFRMVDDNNYYMFRLAGEEGAVLGKMVNNEWIDLANPRGLDFMGGARILPGTWYTLKVKVIGPVIQCFINESPIIHITDSDSPFTVGRFGVCTFKCFADFDYIDVWS